MKSLVIDTKLIRLPRNRSIVLIDERSNFFLLDSLRRQSSSPRRVERLCILILKDLYSLSVGILPIGKQVILREPWINRRIVNRAYLLLGIKPFPLGPRGFEVPTSTNP